MSIKTNGHRLLIYAGVLLVGAVGAFFAVRATANQASATATGVEESLDTHLATREIHERGEVKANRAHREMQEFYDNTIKPDLAAMEARLLRELQELKERIK